MFVYKGWSVLTVGLILAKISKPTKFII